LSALASVILYLLALDGVACASMAWGQPSPLELVGWAVGLGATQLLGERLEASFISMEAKRRDRVGTFLGAIQLSIIVLALVLAAAQVTPKLLDFFTSVFSGYLVVTILLVRLTPHPRGVVGQSLALIALACLRGGPLAAWAASSALGLTALYIGLEHHSRLLASHRVDDEPYAGRALGRSLAVAVPVALLVGIGAAQLDPEPRYFVEVVEEEGFKPLTDKEEHEFDSRALRAIALAGMGGAVAVYFVGRLLNRSKGGEPQAIETPEPLRGRLERIRSKGPRRSRVVPEYRGRRGRIVRAYLNLLRAAESVGFPRRPHETAGEFAVALAQPRDVLKSTTDIFEQARYGSAELTDDDVALAEAGSDAVRAHLSRQPPRRRGGIVRDADAPPPDKR
jgi:hypothetical protein